MANRQIGLILLSVSDVQYLLPFKRLSVEDIDS